MGNTLRTPEDKKRSRKRQPSSLRGLEIVIDQRQEHQTVVSEMFHEGSFEDIHESSETNTDESTIMDISDSTLDLRKSTGSGKSRGGLSNEDAGDLMTCIIPGMDPIEMLNLVQECAQEESKERAVLLRKADRARIRGDKAGGRHSRR